MANVFEYVISIKDKATAAAQKIMGGAAGMSNAFADVNENIERLNKAPGILARLSSKARQAVTGPRFLGRSIDELQNRLEEVNRVRFGTVLRSEFKQASREAKDLERQIDRLQRGISTNGIGGRIAGWRNDFATSLPGASLIANPLVGAGAAIAGIWGTTQKAMDAGKERMKLQVLTGSEEIGSALYEGLTKFATDTVFGSELYDYGVQMLSNGIKQADVLPVMKELGDIAMGDAQKLGQLSLAFAQINGKGKLAGQELLQLINAGFNPLQVLVENTGESMESLQARMSKGQISIDEVRKAMQIATGPGGKFENMLQKVAGTPYGQLEGLKGQLDQMAISMGEVFLPVATGFMKAISWIGEKMGPYLKPAIAIIGGLSVGLLAVAAAQWAWNAAQLANPLTWIIAGVVALIGVITWVITAFDGWGNAWNNLMSGLKYHWLAFRSDFRTGWLQTVNYFIFGVAAIQKAWYKVKALWDEEGAATGLAKLKEDSERRSREIAYQKGLTKAYANMAVDAYGNVFGEKGLHRNDKTLKGTVDGIKEAIMPGMGTAGGAGGAGGAGVAVGKKTNEAIATGGTKNTTIHITIGKQVESLTVVSNNIKEGANKIREIIVDEMIRAAQMGAAMAGA